MGFRTVIVRNRSKLDLSFNNIMIRRSDGNMKVNISEIDMLILESTAISITAALICELVKQKVKIIFCDETSNPLCELNSMYGSHDTVIKKKKQFEWLKSTQKELWTRIVFDKIDKQKNLIEKINDKVYDMLSIYQSSIEYNDETNMEGTSARVYFLALFGDKFSRNNNELAINKALNYGYHILISMVNKEIISNGYLTEFGIHHCNQFNKFNLACDFVEPFRPIVDKLVYKNKFEKFETEEKSKMYELFNIKLKYEGKEYYLKNIIEKYVRNLFNILDKNDISIYESYYEL